VCRLYTRSSLFPICSFFQALADEAEFVRDTALKAGQRIVNMYAETAIELLLPEVEKGLFDDNWRIRYSSIQLLGDLLYRISGTVLLLVSPLVTFMQRNLFRLFKYRISGSVILLFVATRNI